MNFQRFNETAEKANSTYTALLYCAPGVGKSTAIGLIAEASEGNTLVLDIDRTITRTLSKKEIVKNTDKLFIEQVDNIDAFDAWKETILELGDLAKSGKLKENDIRTIAVDNISELERCILSSLGAKGKNKGVPAMADYQYMQFQLVNSLRFMKTFGCNIIWTAWEDCSDFVHPDGTKYSRLVPKISPKIVDNICGLCDVVGKILVDKEGKHGILLEATQNIYAKNQIDDRKACLVENFAKFKKEDEESGEKK